MRVLLPKCQKCQKFMPALEPLYGLFFKKVKILYEKFGSYKNTPYISSQNVRGVQA